MSIANLHKLENQPPCLRRVIFNGYVAGWHEPCELMPERRVVLGPVEGVEPFDDHPGFMAAWFWEDHTILEDYPDTAEEAERLYAEACEWLRSAE